MSRRSPKSSSANRLSQINQDSEPWCLRGTPIIGYTKDCNGEGSYNLP